MKKKTKEIPIEYIGCKCHKSQSFEMIQLKMCSRQLISAEAHLVKRSRTLFYLYSVNFLFAVCVRVQRALRANKIWLT